MNIGSAPTICGSSIEGPSVVGVSATGFGLRPPPFTDTPTTDSHLDCRYARILSVAAHVTVLFGHDCLRPTDNGHARPGRVCPKLGGCLACPGLIVPIDPDHLARIVQATRHLEAAREGIDPIRFGLFYAPSLQVLTKDLLPAFPPEMIPDAERLMSALLPLPDLE